MFILPISSTIVVYDTLTEALVLKKMDFNTLLSAYTFLVSSNTQFFQLFYDTENSFTFFEIDLNFNNGPELQFSGFVSTLTESAPSTEPSSITFTSESIDKTMTPITPTVTDNKADGSIASYGTPAFKTFPRDTLILCYDATTFPCHYDLVGPCTDPDSSYAYSIGPPALPNWLTFTSDSATSTQTISILSSVPFGSANKFEYSNVLKATKDSTTLEKPFTIIVYRCSLGCNTDCECDSVN